MLGLAVWTFAGVLGTVRSRSDRLSPRAARVIVGYLFLIVGFTAATWLRAILPSITADRPAAVTDGLGVATNVVYVQDLALGLPAAAVTVVLLWRSRPGSAGLATAVLTYWAIESASIAVDQWFATAADPATTVASASAVPIFAAVTMLNLLVLMITANLTVGEHGGRGRREPRGHTGRRPDHEGATP